MKKSTASSPRTQAFPSWFIYPFLPALLIVAVALGIYWPSMHGGWIGDDAWYISRNPLLQDPNRLWKAWFAPGSWVEFYPINEVVQYFQWRLWHNQTFGYHLTNVILHIVSSLLIWRLLARFGLKYAWLGGLLFAIHPENVDSVSEIVELKNSLSLPPFLASIWLYLEYDETRSRRAYLWSVTLFIIAMLCKITMATFPFVILLYAWWKRDKIQWRDLLASIPFFGIAFVLGIMTIWAGQIYSQPTENWDPASEPLGGLLFRFVLMGQIIAFYFTRFFLPINPMPIYPRWPVEVGNPLSYLPWLVIAFTLIVLWTRRHGWGRHALLGLGFFFILLLPFLGLNAISYMYATWVFDHMLYVPILGMIGLAVAAFGQIDAMLQASARLWARGALALVFLLLALHSRLYTPNFASEEALATYNLKFNDCSALRNNLGVAMLARDDYPDALKQFQLAQQLNPKDAKVPFNIAAVHLRTRDLAKAIDFYRLSAANAPTKGEIRAALADTLLQAERRPEAIEQFREAIRLKFELPYMHGRLGEALFVEGHKEEALEQFQLAAQADPKLPLAQYNLAKALCQAGQTEEGIQHYRQAIALLPDYAQAHNNLGIALMKQGKSDEALEEFRHAVNADRNYADAENNLALAEKMKADGR